MASDDEGLGKGAGMQESDSSQQNMDFMRYGQDNSFNMQFGQVNAQKPMT